MLSYVSHEIMAGKLALEGLPATFGTQEDCETLRIVCEDSYVGMQVEDFAVLLCRMLVHKREKRMVLMAGFPAE